MALFQFLNLGTIFWYTNNTLCIKHLDKSGLIVSSFVHMGLNYDDLRKRIQIINISSKNKIKHVKPFKLGC